MLQDALLTFSQDQALSASGASTNVYDASVSDTYYGDGSLLAVLVTTDVAADFTSADETYTAKLQMDDNAAFSSPTDVGPVFTYTAAERAVGGQVVLPVPANVKMERYLRVYYTLGGTTPSITVTAAMYPVDQIPFYRQYKDNSTITG